MKFQNVIVLLAVFLVNIVVQAQDITSINERYNTRFNVRMNRYDTDRYNLLIAQKSVPLTGGIQKIEFEGSIWEVQSSIVPAKNAGQFEVQLQFICLEGTLNDASVSFDAEINDWSADNYVLMPSAVYNGNRYPAVKMKYMPFFIEPEQLVLNNPILLSDQPRLNPKEGKSRIQLRSGSMAFPSIGYRNAQNKGFWLFTAQGNSLGDYGYSIEEFKNRKKAVLSITTPVVREVQKYFIAQMDARPSDDKPANFKAGNRVEIKLYLSYFDAPNIQSLYDEMVEIRKEYYPTPEKVNILPFSAAFNIQEKKFNTENWSDAGYYKVGVDGSFFQDWQIGWTGGMISTLPLLQEGSELSKKRAISNFDWLARIGNSPSGYYYDVIYNNKPYGAFPNKALGDSLHLVRKNADAVYYIYKQFDLMKKTGIAIKPEWEAMNKTALDAQLKTWKTYGQLGQFVNQVTGRLVVGNTTSGGIFPAALCAAYRYTGNKEYLTYAEEIGNYYYKNFIQKGLTCGGPGDAMQSFDSESSYGLLESMTELYETTGKKEWLQRSEEMAKQFASWVVAYDFKFPEKSLFNKLDIRSTGAVYANTQNTHGGPGICTHSGIALLKLYRATGNPFYMQLLTDIAHALPQFMSTKDNPWPRFHEGWISERCNLTDWLEGIGETFAYSSWAETSLMLSYAELPGIYINLSNGQIFNIDHINARVLKNTKNQLVIEISNPTRYDAIVKLLAENNAKSAKPLLNNASVNWQKVELKAGEKQKIKFTR